MPPKYNILQSKASLLGQRIMNPLGGAAFLVGSIFYFPFFSSYFGTSQVSAWLFVVGSAAYLSLDLIHLLKLSSPNRNLPEIINAVISSLGSLLFLTGSLCFLPQLEQISAAELLFQVGCVLAMLSSAWKLCRISSLKSKSVHTQDYHNNIQYLAQSMAFVGCLMFLIGTLILQNNQNNHEVLTLSACIFTVGGVLFQTYSVLGLVNTFNNPSPKNDQSLLSASI